MMSLFQQHIIHMPIVFLFRVKILTQNNNQFAIHSNYHHFSLPVSCSCLCVCLFYLCLPVSLVCLSVFFVFFFGKINCRQVLDFKKKQQGTSETGKNKKKKYKAQVKRAKTRKKNKKKHKAHEQETGMLKSLSTSVVKRRGPLSTNQAAAAAQVMMRGGNPSTLSSSSSSTSSVAKTPLSSSSSSSSPSSPFSVWTFAWYFVLFVLFGVAAYLLYVYVVRPQIQKMYDANKEVGQGQGDGGQGNGKSIKVMLFFSYNCPHCIKILPEWKRFADEYDGQNVDGYIVTCQKVDCSSRTVENPLMKQYDIEAFPTVKMIKNGVTYDYDAPVTKQNLEKFIKSN